MTIPVTGALSFNDINVETATTGTWQLSLNDERFRSLAGGSANNTAVSLSVQYGATFIKLDSVPGPYSSTKPT